MAGNVSYYFTLLKKFQVLGHVPEQTAHGNAGAPLGSFNLNDPNSVFGASTRGTLLGATTVPSDSPLWAILNARVGGMTFPTTITVGATAWPVMPTGTGTSPPSWNDFQLTAPVPLVSVFGTWITAGKVSDVPTAALATMPPSPIPGPLDAGISLFVASVAGDTGVRPGAVPSNFWATSLIYLVDPNTGNTVTPSPLSAGDEWYLVAVIGNRGDTVAGKYAATPPPLGVECAATVMVWNTIDSPGVELPSLDNLDVNSNNQIYNSYVLRSGGYDLVGFRLNVQTVFNGVIAALNQAVTAGTINLGGMTPHDWVTSQPAHLCAKVIIREQGGVFPNVGDSPQATATVAQKNLAPFDVTISDTDPNPNIVWRVFVTGTPFFLRIPGAGGSRLIVDSKLPPGAFRMLIGIPTVTFDRYFRNGPGKLDGFRERPRKTLCESPLGGRAKPFPEAVVLEHTGGPNAIEFPPLPEKHYLGMALGIEYDRTKIQHGPLGDVDLVHRAVMPKLRPGTRCYDLEEVVVGGFTLQLRASDPREAFKWVKGKGKP